MTPTLGEGKEGWSSRSLDVKPKKNSFFTKNKENVKIGLAIRCSSKISSLVDDLVKTFFMKWRGRHMSTNLDNGRGSKNPEKNVDLI